jgi:adenylate kinase family enzyme
MPDNSLRSMKRVAVFGNAGGGKSTLARELAAITGLPLAVVDKLQHRAGGVKAPHEEYVQAHRMLLASDEWIIDGFGGIALLWERLEAADTLIHVDLPLAVHALWVTKRLITGLFVAPRGWPEDTPVISSSISSYRVLWSCHTRLTPTYRSYVSEAARRKRVFHLRSRRELMRFLELTRKAHAPVRREADRSSVPADGQAAC